MTKNGADPLLSAEDNCADMVDMPTEEEMNQAITGNMKQLLVVVCVSDMTVNITTDSICR